LTRLLHLMLRLQVVSHYATCPSIEAIQVTPSGVVVFKVSSRCF
jgi:hypothetical protein